MFKTLGRINDQIYVVELAKSEIEYEEPNFVVFFILKYAKLGMLELYCNFFKKISDTNKYAEMELDTDSLYSALADTELYGCIRNEKRQE